MSYKTKLLKLETFEEKTCLKFKKSFKAFNKKSSQVSFLDANNLLLILEYNKKALIKL